MIKVHHSSKGIVPNRNLAPQTPEIASIHNEPHHQDTYVTAKYPGDYQSQPPIKSWASHERSHQQRPVSVISSKYNDFSSNDRNKYSKTKRKNKNDGSSKIWKIVLVTTVVPLSLAVIGISVYGLVTAQMSTTMSTTTTTITTTIAPSLPPQCFAYAIISDATRSSTAAGGGGSDAGAFSGTYTWYRFNSTGGTAIPQFPPSYSRCGGVYPGWYAGPIPTYGYTSSGLVCYVYTSVCYYTNTILVANCGSYYVYGLINSVVATGRYCTI